MGPTPCYLLSQVVSLCQSFKPVAQFFFWQSTFFFLLFFFFSFLMYRKRVWPRDMLKTFSGDTDRKYIWVCGVTLIVQA